MVVASGIALVPLYETTAPLASLEAIQDGVAWGWLLRGVHWFSALGLLVTTALHTFEAIRKRRDKELRAALWWRSTLTLPLVILAMLGGFLLRGDAAAVSAWQVWHGILDSVPLVSVYKRNTGATARRADHGEKR